MSNEEAPPSSKSPVIEGEVIAGKYKIERVLGQGGMGVVVAAMHVHLRQRVAIKFLLPDAGAELVTRFMREARASAKLKSEHIARVIDVAELPEDRGRAPYMVMEYLEGSDLSRVIRKRGALPFDDAVDYLLQACEAIAEAHSVGIVHRDLKPANLFLTKAADGSATVKVLDFGISKDNSDPLSDEEGALTRTTAVLGSPYYMAPEQMRSTRTVDARADIWSIGVILYQLVTKMVPFKAGGFVELALMVVNDEPKPPSVHRADIPPALEAAILRCIRKNPADRFANVAELAAAIAGFGRAGSIASAERIARTQGAPMPVIERSSSLSLVPPPPSAISSSGSGQQSLGSALSSGPSVDLPSQSAITPQVSSPNRPQAASTQPSPGGTIAMSTSPTGRSAMTPPQGYPVVGAAPVIGAAPAMSHASYPSLPHAPSGIPSVPPGPITVPPGGSITGSSTGKDAAHAATASTWAGAPVAAPAPRRSGTRMVVLAGFALGAIAVTATLVALRTRGPAASGPVAAQTGMPASTTSAPAPMAAVTSRPTDEANTAPAEVITKEPTAPSTPTRATGGSGPIEVTAGPVAPALGAPVATTTTSPGARPLGKASAAAAPQPVATAVAVAPPPAAAPVAPPAAPPPPPAAPPPAKKKNPLDMDIQ